MRTMHWVCDGKTKNGAQHERTKWLLLRSTSNTIQGKIEPKIVIMLQFDRPKRLEWGTDKPRKFYRIKLLQKKTNIMHLKI